MKTLITTLCFLLFLFCCNSLQAQVYRFAIIEAAFIENNNSAGQHVYEDSTDDALVDLNRRQIIFLPKSGADVEYMSDIISYSTTSDTDEFIEYQGLLEDGTKKFRLRIQKGLGKDELLFFDNNQETIHARGYAKKVIR